MNSIPVNKVWMGIGLSMLPIMLSRSDGMPDRSKSMAASARTTTSTAMASTPMPENVSITATARRPPKMV